MAHFLPNSQETADGGRAGEDSDNPSRTGVSVQGVCAILRACSGSGTQGPVGWGSGLRHHRALHAAPEADPLCSQPSAEPVPAVSGHLGDLGLGILHLLRRQHDPRHCLYLCSEASCTSKSPSPSPTRSLSRGILGGPSPWIPAGPFGCGHEGWLWPNIRGRPMT